MQFWHKISSVAAAIAFTCIGFAIAPAGATGTSAPGASQGAAVPRQIVGTASTSATDAKAPRLEDGDMVMGAPDAPVTIIEYASLTCPHCAKFHNETLPELKSAYIDTGLVKYVFRDFPLDRVALAAAMVARCAGPERYFGFLEVFFRQQPAWASGNDPNKMLGGLKRLAKLGGMSEAQFDECLKNKEVQDSVLAMSVTGQNKFQVRSTPTLIINGEARAGALSFEELEKILKPLIGRS